MCWSVTGNSGRSIKEERSCLDRIQKSAPSNAAQRLAIPLGVDGAPSAARRFQPNPQCFPFRRASVHANDRHLPAQGNFNSQERKTLWNTQRSAIQVSWFLN